jgi:hypothetical protein
MGLMLVVFPRFLLFAAETSAEPRNVLTPLEAFLALHAGILLFSLSLAMILNVCLCLRAHPRLLNLPRYHPRRQFYPGEILWNWDTHCSFL